MVRIRIPLKRVEEEEDYTNPETGEVSKQRVEKIVEIDIDDKALAIPCRIDAVPYSIFVLH